MPHTTLRTQILTAFSPVPTPATIAPHACAECETTARHLADFSGSSVPDEAFWSVAWDLPLLSDEARQYYLPAWLLRAVPGEPRWWDACAALVQAINAEQGWNPQPPYTREQWLAIDEVLRSAEPLISGEWDAADLRRARMLVAKAASPDAGDA